MEIDYGFELEAAKLGHSWRTEYPKLLHDSRTNGGPDERTFKLFCTCGDSWMVDLNWSRSPYTPNLKEYFHESFREHAIVSVARGKR